MVVTPIAGWFIKENPTKMGDNWGYPLFQETPSGSAPGDQGICLPGLQHLDSSSWYCRASHTGDALRVGGVRGCQAEEVVLAAQV